MVCSSPFVRELPSNCYTLMETDQPPASRWRHFTAVSLGIGIIISLACLVNGQKQPAPSTSALLVRSSHGWLIHTLNVEEGTWRLPHGISVRTRLYNTAAPGSILWAAPGDHLRITLRNQLGANLRVASGVARVGFLEANTTNLHLHGVYDDASHDDTFARVQPGGVKTYQYTLHPDSGTTLLYYHPHAHGSTTLQSLGGMGGALVVEDAVQEAALALPMAATRVLLLQSLDFDPSSSDFVGIQLESQGSSTLPATLLNPSGLSRPMLLVNGGEAQREELPVGRWMRLKVVNALVGSSSSLKLGFLAASGSPRTGVASTREESPCRMLVLSLDGVWLREPRLLASTFLPPGGRAELAVGCRRAGVHTFGSLHSDALGATFVGGEAAIELQVMPETTLGVDEQRVYGRAATPLDKLPRQLPGPPAYYSDLRNAVVDVRHTIEFSSPGGSNVINGRTYDDSAPPSFRLQRGGVVEWQLVSAELPGSLLKVHPYHQHMTHFQIQSVSTPGAVADELGVVVGDWRDTIPLSSPVNYTIRFVAPFDGLMMVHCHILKHSDFGMMSLALIQ